MKVVEYWHETIKNYIYDGDVSDSTTYRNHGKNLRVFKLRLIFRPTLYSLLHVQCLYFPLPYLLTCMCRAVRLAKLAITVKICQPINLGKG